MALIPKTNITTGNTIQASDITNIVEALDGTPGSYTVITTGSFTGSFTGALAGSSSYALTASYALNGGGGATTGGADEDVQYNSGGVFSGSSRFSFNGTKVSITNGGTLNATGSLQGSSSYALTASYALNAGGGVGFPFTGSAIISSSLAVTGSMKISGSLTFTGPEAYAQVENPLVYLNTAGGKSNISVIEGFYKSQNKAIVGATDKLGTLDLSLVGSINTSGFSKGLVIPVSQSLDPVIGSMYLDDGNKLLYVYTSTGWLSTALT